MLVVTYQFEMDGHFTLVADFEQMSTRDQVSGTFTVEGDRIITESRSGDAVHKTVKSKFNLVGDDLVLIEENGDTYRLRRVRRASFFSTSAPRPTAARSAGPK
jgi:hypothetical protein